MNARTAPTPARTATGNLVLDALPASSRERILDHAREVDLQRSQNVWDVRNRITTVQFPIDAVGSLITVMSNGTSVEAAMLARDGMIGLPVVLGRRTWGMTRAVIQIPGRGYTLGADEFERILADDPKLAEFLRSVLLALMTEITQSVACNRLHPADERLARWLGRAHDGAQRDQFPLTHEFLAQMLGVRRATVTVAAQTLKEDELIAYRRGSVAILDPGGLRERACECYDVVTGEYRRAVESA